MKSESDVPSRLRVGIRAIWDPEDGLEVGGSLEATEGEAAFLMNKTVFKVNRYE
jgi:hypothetical protein